MSALALVFFLLPGCFGEKEPEAIRFGVDTCAHCRMTISDNRFGGEIIMKGGKIQKFDALECVREYAHAHNEKVQKIFFLDFYDPGQFVSSAEARFVKAESIRGPMGQDHLVMSQKTAAKRSESSESIDWLQYQKQAGAIKSSGHHQQ